jgi:signal transduction histidine kinase
MNIRNKITTLFTILTGAIILMLSIFIYHFSKRSVDKEFFHRLSVRGGIAAQAHYEEETLSAAVYNEIREKHLQRLPEEREYFFDTLPDADSLKQSGILLPVGFEDQMAKNTRVEFIIGKMYYVAIPYQHEGKKYTVLMSARNESGELAMKDMRQNLFLGIVLSVIIVFVVGLLFSAEIVNPISTIISRVKKISASNLDMRLPEREGKGEIADLTQTFNDMLDRLETSFETQRNFVNKLSHELRTPLTAIIGEAELALDKERNSTEYQEALSVIAREADQLHHLTTSLLELAQAGNSVNEEFMGEIRLDELVLSVKKLVDFTDPQNHIHLNFEELPDDETRITIFGNQNLLKLAITNVVQNACKYSNNGKVTISLRATEKQSILIVEDQGIGIPQKELRYIFDPFFRASNTTAYKGYGVGLPLAQKIIRIHRGEIKFTSMEGAGTRAEMRFPIQS